MMLKSKSKLIVPIILSVCLAMFCWGCAGFGSFSSTPNKEEIIKSFTASYDDFVTIVDYMASLEYEFCFIDDDNGQYFGDFEYYSISDSEVCAAIKRLWKMGCHDVIKDMADNSISFELWYSVFEIDAGVLYQIDPTSDSRVQYMTQIEETDNEGWCYYVADYNLWRIQNQRENGEE